MFKKTLAVAITVLLVFLVLPSVAFAESSGGYEYSVNGSKVTITGYTGPGGAITIPPVIGGLKARVTAIADDAFAGNTTITSVVFPEGVRIGARVFSSCGVLVKATLPATISQIGEGAFLSCPKLTIYGYTGSVTEKYAAAAKIPFETLTKHIVTFDSKGGSAVAKASVQHGKPVAQPASPKRTGYTFSGWYRDSACTSKWNFSSPITKDMKLYAKWKYGEPGPAYKIGSSATTVYSGKSVKFTLTTPKSVSKVKLYLDGKYNKRASRVKTSGGSRLWSVSLVLNIVGTRKVQFKAYSGSGRYMKSFPSSPLKITVKHSPPSTLSPIVLDADKAVLLGKPPVKSGPKQTSHGFYYGESADALSKKVPSSKIIRGCINRLVTDLKPETKYYCRAYTVTSIGEFLGPVVSFTTPAAKVWATEGAIFRNTSDRYKYLFKSTLKFYTLGNPPFGYNGSTEAGKHIVNIKVPVWKLENGNKVESYRYLKVNYKLAENVKAIFGDIYALAIKFPIAELSGYQYRHISGDGLPHSDILSHHGFGAAIDINDKVNDLYIGKDKRNPKSPYYIPRSVIDIFAKYGWAWGGNFKECKDTMHFQYLGLDLMGKRK